MFLERSFSSLTIGVFKDTTRGVSEAILLLTTELL